MKDNKNFLINNEIDIDKLPLESLVRLQKLYEDQNLTSDIKKVIEKKGLSYEKIS